MDGGPEVQGASVSHPAPPGGGALSFGSNKPDSWPWSLSAVPQGVRMWCLSVIVHRPEKANLKLSVFPTEINLLMGVCSFCPKSYLLSLGLVASWESSLRAGLSFPSCCQRPSL